MEWTDEFEPTSQINGNIEITFNSKNKEFDMYEPITEQLVLTVGKTGRANRLTFDAPTSEELLQTAKVLQKLGEELKELEEEQSVDEEEFDASNIESGLTSEEEKEIKEIVPDDTGISKEAVIKVSTMPAAEVEETLQKMKRDGDLYEPEEGKLQKI